MSGAARISGGAGRAGLAVCAVLLAAPLAAQPKLLVAARPDTRSAAAGLESVLRPLLAAAQPAWIGYSVPAVPTFQGCEFVRDGAGQAGVVHLEPPGQVLVLYRVEAGELARVRTASPDCEIDAGGLPFHWLEGVAPAQSVAFLAGLADARDRAGDAALSALALHADPAAEAALRRYLDSSQPVPVRQRAVSAFGRRSGPGALAALSGVIRNDPDVQVKRRAVSALQSMPAGEGIPALIELARTTRDNELRKQAMNSLSASRDLRAVAFFEQLLK